MKQFSMFAIVSSMALFATGNANADSRFGGHHSRGSSYSHGNSYGGSHRYDSGRRGQRYDNCRYGNRRGYSYEAGRYSGRYDRGYRGTVCDRFGCESATQGRGGRFGGASYSDERNFGQSPPFDRRDQQFQQQGQQGMPFEQGSPESGAALFGPNQGQFGPGVQNGPNTVNPNTGNFPSGPDQMLPGTNFPNGPNGTAPESELPPAPGLVPPNRGNGPRIPNTNPNP